MSQFIAQCKILDLAGWFLSLSENALCKECDVSFQIDLHERVRVIQDSVKIIKTSRNLDTKLSRIRFAIDNLKVLHRYEQHGISTILPEPSEAIQNYELRIQEEVTAHAVIIHDEAMAKIDTTESGKLTALSKALLKLRNLAKDNSMNLKNLEQSLSDRIARETVSDYLEKARKAEFKGQKKKALENYYEALYFLANDEIDDHLQAQHMSVLEKKILFLGGTLNYERESSLLGQELD